jgi:hypothetical protein
MKEEIVKDIRRGGNQQFLSGRGFSGRMPTTDP